MLNKQQCLLLASLILMLSVIPLYKIKSRLGINILPGLHTPNLVEEWTGGSIKARWIDRNYFRRSHSQ
jgi:hypothetical protein